jgi:acyl-CoA thioesterase I
MGQSSIHPLDHASPFRHPEGLSAQRPVVNDQRSAAISDVDAPRPQQTLQTFGRCARDEAFDLLCDPIVEAFVDHLTLREDAVIASLSDNIPDDRMSWAEILRVLLELRRPEDRVRVISLGMSGETTSQMISRFADIVPLRPDWIICAAGANDARRQGPAPAQTQFSTEETSANLTALRRLAATLTRAYWIWVAPTPIIEARIIADRLLGSQLLTWKNADLAAIAALMHSLTDPVVDVQAAFGCPPDPALLLSNGFHPSLAGHALIARTLLEKMSGQSTSVEETDGPCRAATYLSGAARGG